MVAAADEDDAVYGRLIRLLVVTAARLGEAASLDPFAEDLLLGDLDQALGLPKIIPNADPRVAAATNDPRLTLLRAREIGLILWVFHGAV